MEIEIIPNRNILASARAFYETAQILNKEEFSNKGVPIIVNSAFALELYLKSFNSKKIFKNGTENQEGVTIYETVVNKANAKDHKLVNLYAAISPEIKQQIESKNTIINESFEKALFEYNNIFVEWRYSFEGNNKGVNITKMFTLLKTLENTALVLEQKS